MNDETLTALKKSIVKWQANEKAETPNDYKTGIEECPLCDLYYGTAPSPLCKRCPIMNQTNKAFCISTPYIGASFAWRQWGDHPGNTDLRDAAHAAAKAMADFLETLLPEKCDE